METDQDKSFKLDHTAPRSGRGRSFAIVIMTLAILALSVIVRIHFIQTRPSAGRMDGQEPESHILVTDLAFEQTSWKIHHFLPIFTYGAAYDKYIDQHPHAASPDAFGNYYYCSTPPLTFVLPYLATKSVGGSPSFSTLRCYNVTLQILGALGLAALVFLCAKRKGAAFELCLLASATALVIYMTAPECLKTHTINLWGQQFYAPLLMAELICFLFYPSAILLFVFAFIGCLDDWTPYLANMAMAGIAAFSYWKTRNPRALGLGCALLLGCFVAGIFMIGWFSTVISVHDYFHNLAARSGSRSGSFSDTTNLVLLYANSFGLFLLIALVLLLLRPWSGNPVRVAKPEGVILPDIDPFLVALFVIAVALAENVLMGGHAMKYSYDRLKGVQFLALFIAWAACRKRTAGWAFAACVAAGLFSIFSFLKNYDMPDGSRYMAQTEQQRLGALIQNTASTNGPAFFNGDVRGAEVYYAGRNVFQFTWTTTDFYGFAQRWCRLHHFSEATVYLISGHYPYPATNDLPRSVHISRVYTDGKIVDLGSVPLPEKPGDYHPFTTWWGHPFRQLSGQTPLLVLKMWLWE